MSTTPSPNSLWFGSYSSLKLLCQTLIASLDSERSSPSGTSRAPPVRQMAPVRRRWPSSSGRRCWHGRHGAPHSLSPSILLLPLSRARSGGNAVAIAAESFASSSRPRLCISLCLRAPPSPPRAPPSSPPISWTRSPRGERHFASSPSSGSRPSRHRFRRTSPLLHPCFLSSLWVALGSA